MRWIIFLFEWLNKGADQDCGGGIKTDSFAQSEGIGKG
jgi:hypothetical protein